MPVHSRCTGRARPVARIAPSRAITGSDLREDGHGRRRQRGTRHQAGDLPAAGPGQRWPSGGGGAAHGEGRERRVPAQDGRRGRRAQPRRAARPVRRGRLEAGGRVLAVPGPGAPSTRRSPPPSRPRGRPTGTCRPRTASPRSTSCRTSRAAPARSPSPTTARSSTRPTTPRSTPSRCASPSAATTPGTAAVEPGSGG
jgi:hypothetical protein